MVARALSFGYFRNYKCLHGLLPQPPHALSGSLGATSTSTTWAVLREVKIKPPPLMAINPSSELALINYKKVFKYDLSPRKIPNTQISKQSIRFLLYVNIIHGNHEVQIKFAKNDRIEKLAPSFKKDLVEA